MNSTQTLIVRPPVERMAIQGKENPLSKCIRKCDNKDLTEAAPIGVYISTNETGLAKTREILNNTPKIKDGCHIGFSGWHNFDIMVIRKSDYAIICDINPENAYFLHHVLEMIKNNSDRLHFVGAAASYVKKVDRTNIIDPNKLETSVAFQPNVSEDPIYDDVVFPSDEIPIELKREGSWLNTDESYQYIRKLAQNDKIVLISENILNTATFEKIKNVLQNNNFQIDSLYVSNIHDYMNTKENRETFLKTIDTLSENETIIITTDSQLIQKSEKAKSISDKNNFFFGEIKYYMALLSPKTSDTDTKK